MRECRVLVACEESGTVRNALIAKGVNAISCDLLPTRSKGPHYEGNVFDLLDYPWDAVIAHPPCTHIAVSGAAHFVAKRMDGRQQAGVSFIMKLVRLTQHVPFFCLEQPVGILSSCWRKPDQIVQPWQFGHGETKATCLWLRGFAKLNPTKIVSGRTSRIHNMAPSPNRARERSVTYQGIADAMADQWFAKGVLRA